MKKIRLWLLVLAVTYASYVWLIGLTSNKIVTVAACVVVIMISLTGVPMKVPPARMFLTIFATVIAMASVLILIRIRDINPEIFFFFGLAMAISTILFWLAFKKPRELKGGTGTD